MVVTGRLAPSPTGAQHLGNARTYLIAWLSARSQSGKVALRTEDIDSPRVKDWATAQLFDDLHWLGLDWDGEVLTQTERLDAYEKALDSLRSRELVYPCACTRGDIERAASAPHLDHESPPYPGTCSFRRVADAAALGNRPFAWRVRTDAEPLTWLDGFHGATTFRLSEVSGDFVVWKSAGTPAYQLAVVVDDAAQHVTEVVRGDDLLASTPRQLLLYRLLGLPPPRFIHVPLVVGPDQRRLAKRHGDARLATFRAAGVSSEWLVGLLAWSCGWQETVQPITPRALLRSFSLDTIPRRPFVLEPELMKSPISPDSLGSPGGRREP